MVRAKFVVYEVAKRTHWEGGFAWNVKMNPVSAKEGEGSIFGKATPSGNLEMLITSEEAARHFTPGFTYYIDIYPVK